VIADQLIWDAVKASKVIREGASEEDPIVRDVDEDGEGEYTVCWDPLDGSSIVDNNWAVGTMIVRFYQIPLMLVVLHGHNLSDCYRYTNLDCNFFNQ
jgi:fructose-1,6-bisphosphatase